MASALRPYIVSTDGGGGALELLARTAANSCGVSAAEGTQVQKRSKRSCGTTGARRAEKAVHGSTSAGVLASQRQSSENPMLSTSSASLEGRRSCPPEQTAAAPAGWTRLPALADLLRPLVVDVLEASGDVEAEDETLVPQRVRLGVTGVHKCYGKWTGKLTLGGERE